LRFRSGSALPSAQAPENSLILIVARSHLDCRAATLSIPLARATAHSDLHAIRRLRNRIAHHEPIFTRNIATEYWRIHEMIGWRSQVAAAWMDRKQGVTRLIPLKP